MSSNPKSTPTRTARKAKRSKKENPNLNLLLKRLEQKIDQRFDALDHRIDAVERKVDAVDQKVDTFRQEFAVESKAVRAEMAQGLDLLRRELLAAMKHVSDGAYEHYLRIENERRVDIAEFRENQRQLLTSHDNAAKNYNQFSNDSKIIDAEHQDLKRDVETLKKRDMEKAAAIEKIEKKIEQLKAA